MPVSFDKLVIGKEYERPDLANMWGYKGFQAISRGVVTPSGTNYIILFVTKQKQESLTKYNDYLDGNLLHWEGEEKHFSDRRIINAQHTNDEIHLFYREIHHTPFVYYGKIHLTNHRYITSAPSQFVFMIGNETHSFNIFDDIVLHEDEYKSLNKTEKESIVKSRIGQGLFRDGVVDLWKSCAVTGLSNILLLRASHIKPWRESSNHERLDPMNGLLLQPIYDHLFDFGLITFDENGAGILSTKLSQDDIERLKLTYNFKLRKIPERVKDYMEYHRKHVFKNL